MPTSDKSDNEKLTQLINLVSGLPDMQTAIHGIKNDFLALSTVASDLQTSMASIEPLRLIVSEHGKDIEDMRLNMISKNNAFYGRQCCVRPGPQLQATSDLP